ncbi:MAG: hypothetical protein Q9160_005271 [Pyrenula sp. 1 TL-2023]
MPVTSAPFALFCLVDIPNEKINTILTLASKGAGDFDLFLISSSKYDDLPHGESAFGLGTQPPISSSFSSPFTNKSISSVTSFMLSLPQDVNLDRRHFVVLDETTKASIDDTAEGGGEGPKVTLCRIGMEKEEGYEIEGEELSTVPSGAKVAASTLGGLRQGTWGELLMGEQYRRALEDQQRKKKEREEAE